MNKIKSKEEIINRWCQIIPAVFLAENVVQERDGWKDILKCVNEADAEEREKIANEYVRAIATEIVEGGKG